MIKHEVKAGKHLVTPMTEKAARFLNTFVNRTVVMDEKEWQSVELEMSAHQVWVMGSKKIVLCAYDQRFVLVDKEFQGKAYCDECSN